MKTLIIALKTALMLACFTSSGMAQPSQVVANNFNAFIGTWEYQQGNEVFRITLAKSMFNSNGFGGIGCVVGGYYYQKDGVVVADFQHYLPNPVSTTVRIVGFSSSADGVVRNATRLEIVFVDDQKEGKMAGDGSSFTLLTPTTARWVIRESEGVYIMDASTGEYIGTPPPPDGFSVPTDVVMTKVVEQTPPNPPVVPGAPIGWIDFGD